MADSTSAATSPKFTDTIKGYLNTIFSDPKKKYVMYVLIAVFFAIAGYYVYKFYIMPKLNDTDYVPNKEYVNEGEASSKSADIFFFYADWCPHCKTAKPEWDAFKKSIENGTVNGYHLNFHEIDGEKDTGMADKFKVTGFPTIKLVHDDQIIEYDAKPNKNTLMQFIRTTLT